jgi:Ni/Fe-hydrogenase subunit HybB-like protein
VLILMDVGSPLGVWRIAVSGQWTSLMVWDFYLLLLGLVGAGLAWLTLRPGGGRQAWRVVLAVVLVVVAAAIVVAESWLLSTNAAHPYWESGLTTLSFLVGAAIGALSVGVVLLDGQPREQVRRWLVLALAASAVMVVADVLAGALAGTPRAFEATWLVASSPLLWVWVTAGFIVPLYLLTRLADRPAWLGVGAGLALLGVVVEKTQLLAVGQAQPWLPGPLSRYLPSWIEIVGVVGLAAAGALVYGLLTRLRQPAD